MAKTWVSRNDLSAHEFDGIKDALGITNDLFVHVLYNRGLRTKQEWKNLIDMSDEQILSPFAMKDMDLAVSYILNAKNFGHKVLVYGDYDVDGTTAVTMMFGFLQEIGVNCDFYIPDRYKEGYGVSKQGVDNAIANNHKLIIALDCGIRSVELVKYAKENGVDFIICDHHLPGPEIPDAVAVLNPKQADCKYPFKELSGCGIGFKLIQALVDSLGLHPSYFEKYYDLVAVSIASDLVSMTGENRALMKKGLQKLMKDPIPGFRIITASLPENRRPTVSNVVFMIGPRINAAGRMASGMDAVRLMLAKDVKDVQDFSKLLNDYNISRRDIDRSITSQAMEILDSDPENELRFSSVVYQEEWHKGVIGIVASRLMEKYYRPTIVLTKSGDVISGSARSIPGFNVHDALEKCKDHLIQFGGHYFAAGMTLKQESLQDFTDAFEQIASSTLNRDQLTEKLFYDCEVLPDKLSLNVYNSLQKIAPFGPDNPKPLFVSRNLSDTGSSRRIGSDGTHLKLVLRDRGSGTTVNGIAFGMGDLIDMVQAGPVDIIYHLGENHFNGNTSLQIEVQDIRPGE